MGFDRQLFIFLDKGGLNLGDDLVSDICNMSATFNGRDRVGERNLLELSITERGYDLPPVILLLNDFGQLFILLIFQVEITVIAEILDFDPFAIYENFHLGVWHSRHIVGSLGEKRDCVVVQSLHFELLQVWVEGDFREILAGDICGDGWLFCILHVVCEHLLVVLVGLGIACLKDEFFAENIGQLCSVPVPSSSGLLLIIVIIGRSEQLTEDHLWHVAFLILMNLDWDTFSIVPDRNFVFWRIDFDPDAIHGGVSLEVVRSVDEYLI